MAHRSKDIVIPKTWITDGTCTVSSKYTSLLDFLDKRQIAYAEMYSVNGGDIFEINSTSFTPLENTDQSEFYNIDYGAPVGTYGDSFVIKTPGTYQFVGAFAISVSQNNVDVETGVFLNEVELPESQSIRSFQGVNASGAFAITFLKHLQVGDKIDVRFKGSNTFDLIVEAISFNLTLLRAHDGV
tara:strand:+ start:156 stop:710 length:555 start_codon:yes stop_codon:yes gene_type:complete